MPLALAETFPELWQRSFYLVYNRAWSIVQQRLEEHYRPLGVSVRGVWVLMCADERPCCQELIARHLEINRNVMVQVVDCLEHGGLLKRVKNPDNRREYILTPTTKGHALLNKFTLERNAVAAMAFKPLPIETVRLMRDEFLRIVESEDN